jgi:hypothetical protein
VDIKILGASCSFVIMAELSGQTPVFRKAALTVSVVNALLYALENTSINDSFVNAPPV